MTTTTTTPVRYLDMLEIATRTGYNHDHVRALKREGKLPPPDATIGTRWSGWLPETIDAWVDGRPSAPTTTTTTTEETT